MTPAEPAPRVLITGAMIGAAQDCDVAGRPRDRSWHSVPDDQAARLLAGAWPLIAAAERERIIAGQAAAADPDRLAHRERARVQAETDLVRQILVAVCERDGLSLDSGVEPGEPARNYELALRLGIGRILGLPEDGADRARQREISVRAEEIHAEHHYGHVVPSLDSCPEHDRAEYEALVTDLIGGDPA